MSGAGVTLESYCEEKGLDRAIVAAMGVREGVRRGEVVLLIPWCSPGGEIVSVQTRFGESTGGPRFMFRKGDRHLLYGLPRLGEARAARVVVVGEGVTECYTCWQSGIPAVGRASAGSWQDDRDAPYLEGIEEIVWIIEPGAGAAASRAALRRAVRVRDRVQVLVMPDLAKDLNLFYLLDPVTFVERWRVLLEQARPWAEWEAEQVAGEARARITETAGGEVLDLAGVLATIEELLRGYVVLSVEQALALTLWALFTHLVDAFEVTPYLNIRSPEMRSGKTTTLWLLEAVAREPWPVIQPSDAVLYRKIERDHPTLLLDEGDTIFAARASERFEPLRSLLNAANWRGVKVPRCVGPTQELKDFEIFCPKALAGIGNYLPHTVADRCITIELQRKRRGDVVKRRRRREIMLAGAAIQTHIAALQTAEMHSTLAAARPEIPEELDDRGVESWEPLLAIADLAGGEYPARARAAAVTLSGGGDDSSTTIAHRLLADSRAVFDDDGAERLTSGGLIEHLCQLPDAPWSEYRNGKPITGRRVADLLKPYGIRPQHAGEFRGYLRRDFVEVWERYLEQRSTDSEVS